MAKRTAVQKINDRGHGNGWMAEELQKDAERSGITMAELWRVRIKNAQAFNVPAVCVRVTAWRVHYRFADGSTDSYPN